MSTLHASLPGFLYTPRRLAFDLRGIVALSIAVAVTCATIVFLVLYNSDERYPVSAIRAQTSEPKVAPQAVSIPQLVKPLAPSTISTKPPEAAVVSKPVPIARTHNELLALEGVGDRNYIEFSVTKTESFQPVGPIEISFWRSDAKRGTIRISVLSQQRRINFDNLKLYEAVALPGLRSQNLELVINGLKKNQITGYLVEPKNESWQIARNSAAFLTQTR